MRFAEVSWSPFVICGMDFSTLTCVLLIYGFIGWAYESSIFSLAEQGKFMNRGCFIGPYCPIYGVVSVVNLYLLHGIESPLKIIIISSLSVCAIEYVTSWALEKVFHARYWDYSYYPLNINGRISVISGIFFGLAILFLIKILHPAVMHMLLSLSPGTRYYAAIAAWGIFLSDAVFTTIGMCNLNRKCKELYDSIDKYMDKQFDRVNEKKDYFKKFRIVKQGEKMLIKIKGVNKLFVEMETNYLKAVPDFHSTKYSDIIEKMRMVMRHTRKNEANLVEFSEEDITDDEDEDEISSNDKAV